MKPKSKIEVVTFPANGIKPKAPSAELRSAIGRVLLGKYAAQDILDVCAAAQLHAHAMDGQPVIFAKETSPAGAVANSRAAAAVRKPRPNRQ